MFLQETTGKDQRAPVNKEEFKHLDWLFPETTKNFHKLPLQFRGYCGWAMVKYDRLLIPSNPEVGVLRHKVGW